MLMQEFVETSPPKQYVLLKPLFYKKASVKTRITTGKGQNGERLHIENKYADELGLINANLAQELLEIRELLIVSEMR